MEENENKKDIIEITKIEDENKETIDTNQETVKDNKNDSTINNKEDINDPNGTDDKKGLAIASMILGIVSLVMFCAWGISIICAILALIFGIIGRKSSEKGMANTGIITAIIQFSLSILAIICFVIFIIIGINEDNRYDYNKYKYYDYHNDYSMYD